MKLTTLKRAANKKSEVKQLRRNGKIPAILYGRGEAGNTIIINENEFKAYLRSVKKGHLPTTIFTLVDEDGKERRALIKEIQYEITTYAVNHLDFEELLEDQQINVKVPIECVGMADCVGIKLGGILRQVIRHVMVRCLPKDMPIFFEVDVCELAMRQAKRLSDIRMPHGVRPLVSLNEVVAAIVKR